MSIKIKISPILYQYTNNQRVAETNGNTVGQCLDHLAKQFPKLKLFDKDSKLFPYLRVYVNGKSFYPEELKKPVKNGDELSLIFIIGGG